MPIPVPVELDHPVVTGGLLTAARPLPQGWQRGISFLDTSCLSPVTMGECPTLAGLKPGQRPESATFRPFSIVQAVECTTASQLDLSALSASELDRTRDAAIARELLTGQATARDAGPASTGNPALVYDAGDLGAAFTSVGDAIAAVEASVLAANWGRGVVLLVPVAVLVHAVAASAVWRDGARWRTASGGTVIASAGFDGRGPGDTAAPAPGAPLYLYGVSGVWASVGERAVYRSLDRAVNTDTARAEDIALAVYEPCAVFAAAATTVVQPPEPAVLEPVMIDPGDAPEGDGANVLLTYVPGVVWTVNGVPYGETEFGGQPTLSVPGGSGETVVVSATGAPGYRVVSTPTSWTVELTGWSPEPPELIETISVIRFDQSAQWPTAASWDDLTLKSIIIKNPADSAGPLQVGYGTDGSYNPPGPWPTPDLPITVLPGEEFVGDEDRRTAIFCRSHADNVGSIDGIVVKTQYPEAP